MKLLRYILRHNKRLLAAAVQISLITGISSAFLMALISQRLTGKDSLDFAFIGYFIGLVLIVLLLELTGKWLLIRLTTWNSYHLRMHLAQQILSKDLCQLENIGIPRLLALLTDDVRGIAQALHQIPSLCISIAIIAACSAYLAWLSPPAFLTLLLLAIPAAWGHRLLHQKGKQAFAKIFAMQEQRFNHFKALTEGAKELKLHQRRRQDFYQELFETTEAAFHHGLQAGRTWNEIATTWSQSLYFVFIAGIFVLAVINQTSPAVLTGYALVALYMKAYVARFLSGLPQWSEAEVTLQQIEELGFSLEAPDKPVDWPQQVVNAPLHLQLNGVTHAYQHDLDDSHFTLGPINLSLASGELVFLTGGNGSGKTTLIKLLAGLYIPEAGQVYLNGVPVTSGMLESYRQNFTVLFSDFYLFEQLLGLEKNSLDTEAGNYLTKLQLEHKVSIENGNISTTRLSTGQRKRLALLTAYLEDRPVYIFDEWAASQDPVFKEIFYRQLLPELKARGKLVIVISHDDHYYDVADRVIKLDYGKVEADSCPLQATDVSPS
ncbi:MAG: cyclic peptide export ABC transporter [Thiothrix sp.]